MPPQTHIVAPGDRVVHLKDLHRRYIDGETLETLGAEYGVGHKTILKRFRLHGFKVRARGRPPGRLACATRRAG